MTFAFGVFDWDGDAGELRKSGRIIALEPQPARAMGLLLARAGEIVSREEMIAHVWGSDTHVDFNRGLAYCIAQVRAALGDSGDNPRFVQTLPKRGFKFIAPVNVITPVRPADLPAAPKETTRGIGVKSLVTAAILLFALIAGGAWLVTGGAWPARAFLGPARPVVAVSIFDNETGLPQYDRPVKTMSDVVVDRLTSLGPERIGVVGNAPALRMPRSERDLDSIKTGTGAAFVVLAQLQHRNAGLSLIMHLIRLDDGTHLWTRRIARPAGDNLTGLEEEAALAIEGAARQFVVGSGRAH